MKRILLPILSCVLACSAGQAFGDGLRAGAARADITPPPGQPLWGYAARHDAPSEGVLDPLQARGVVLVTGEQRLAVVSLDLGRAPTRQSMATIRRRVKAATGVEHLFLVASHTHHGPVLEVDSWPDPKAPYTRQLEDKIVDLITRAAGALRPARLGVAAKAVPLNHNRQSRLPAAPVDGELIVLRLEDEAGKPIAHLVNFAAHPTLLDSKGRKFSADYPGVLAAVVEKETAAPCLFLQGAAGDLSPQRTAGATPEKFGQALAREVLALAGSVRCAAVPAASLQVREHDFRFEPRVNLGNPLLRAAFTLSFYKELVDFYEREYREGVRPHLTTALVNGNVGLVGVSGEFFCGHALQLKRRARLEHLLFLGYCNDYQQYFPTVEAAAEGGYGASPEMAPAEVGAGERMMDRALIDLYEMRGKLKKLGF